MAAERRARKTRRTSAAAKAPAAERKPAREVRALSRYLDDPEAAEFDRLVYERIRLGIMSALAVNAVLSFSELRDLLKTSDGNLSVHARKLEEAGLVACAKSFEGRVPRTEYRITPRGRAALERYLGHMEALFRVTKGS